MTPEISQNHTFFCLHHYTDITVGFEHESYTFSEPMGALETVEEVCLVISRGHLLGLVLIVNVTWTAVSATGKY